MLRMDDLIEPRPKRILRRASLADAIRHTDLLRPKHGDPDGESLPFEPSMRRAH